LALTPPDQPPKAASGAVLTPSLAYGQMSAVQSTSLPEARSRTFFDPGVIMAPTLSMTFDFFLSMASEPISPQSIDSAHWPEMNRLRVSPTSRLISLGGPN